MGRAGFAKAGKKCVNERAVCEQFLSAASAERKEVFLEAEVSSGVKAVGHKTTASRRSHWSLAGFGR